MANSSRRFFLQRSLFALPVMARPAWWAGTTFGAWTTAAQMVATGFWRAQRKKFIFFVSQSAKVLASAEGQSWLEKTMPYPTTSRPVWNGVASSGSVYCAVGYSSWVATSPDGMTWTYQTIPVSDEFFAIAWNGTVFCAVGQVYSIVSSNGVTWSASALPVGAALSICAKSSVFCALVSASYRALTSTDGLTWTTQTLGTSALNGVAWNGSLFCGVGLFSQALTSPTASTWTTRSLPSAYSAYGTWAAPVWSGAVACTVSGYSNTAAYSSDGITWVAATLPSVQNWSAIAWNGSVFCAVAKSSNVAATSPNGTTWSAQTLSATAAWSAIAWNGTVFSAITSGSATAATSPDGVTWTARTAQSGNWNCMTAGGSLFCAVPINSAKAMTSPDGITWTFRTLPSTEPWNSIAWNGTEFRATISGAGMTVASSNGITWTVQNDASFYVRHIAANGSKFVGVGFEYFAANVSGTWISGTLGGEDQYNCSVIATNVAWCGSQWVALASNSSTVIQSTRHAYTSSDGINWVFRPNLLPPVFTSQAAYVAISALSTTFCAITSNSAATSVDGVTWILRTLPTQPGGGDWASISNNGTLFCVVGAGGYAATSPDGVSWTAQTMPSSAAWSAVTARGSSFVALASDALLAATSGSGLTWASQTLPLAPLYNLGWARAVWNGSQYVAVAGGVVAFENSNSVATSADGILWRNFTLPASAMWQDVAWNGSVFCAIALETRLAATSPDGKTWTLRTLPLIAFWQRLSWNGTVFCVLDGSNGNCATSADGINWTAGSIGRLNAVDIVSNGTIFVALVQDDVTLGALTSSDGLTWTSRSIPASYFWGAVAWNKTVFCAVASYDSTSNPTNAAATSSDGINWTLRTLTSSENWSYISSAGSLFCAANFNDSNYATSTDGINWTARTLPDVPSGTSHY